jgi:Protein phosphatase 2C
VEILYDAQSSPGSRNEDLVLATNDLVVLLDGATPIPDCNTGCIHDVPWLVQRLASELCARLIPDDRVDLRVALAESIAAARRTHEPTCDLTNPDSPSSTVAILRKRAGLVDALVLADSPVILQDVGGTVHTVIDDRISSLPGYSLEEIRQWRNQPGGFWVASTRPEAAANALVRTMEASRLKRAAVLSDGASRLVDRYGRSWTELLDILDREGPRRLVEHTRAAESSMPPDPYGGKRHDDATAVLCRFP